MVDEKSRSYTLLDILAQLTSTLPGGGISQAALEATKKAESEAEAKAQHARAAAEKAAAEKAAADAKVVILESVGICPFVCVVRGQCVSENWKHPLSWFCIPRKGLCASSIG
jgi:hypothetical protein